MATFHLAVKTGKRGIGLPHFLYVCRLEKYSLKDDLEYLESGNMPTWAVDNPRQFWAAADNYERDNGRSYREIEGALPRELTNEQRIELVQSFRKKWIDTNYPYTLAIHCP
ncbi:MAG: MobA/MobL family protein, partial [Dissulfurispiraceae bacterium]